MFYAALASRGLIALSGDDTIAFLQGLISNDARLLEKGAPIYAALLSPQGKFLHDFFLLSRNGKILIDCEKARLEDLRKRLALYKLRSKVTIEVLDENVTAIWGGKSELGFADPRLEALGRRVIGDAPAANATETDYDKHRLALGIPDGSRDMIIDKSILLDFGFEDLHGVDFQKGCYVGQEVTARSKYRGDLKKCLHQLRKISGPALPEAGTPITANGQAIGEIRSSADDAALAIIRLEELAKARAAGHKLQCGECEVEAMLPAWFTRAA